jgi:hypothetical protein
MAKLAQVLRVVPKLLTLLVVGLAVVGCGEDARVGAAVEPARIVNHLTNPALLSPERMRTLYPESYRLTEIGRLEPPDAYRNRGAVEAVLWTFDGADNVGQMLFFVFPDSETARRAWNNGSLPREPLYHIKTKTKLDDFLYPTNLYPAMLLTGTVKLPDSTLLGFSDGIAVMGNVIVRTFTQTPLTPYSANSDGAVLLMFQALSDLHFHLGLGQ